MTRVFNDAFRNIAQLFVQLHFIVIGMKLILHKRGPAFIASVSLMMLAFWIFAKESLKVKLCQVRALIFAKAWGRH
jgi:hypothetical protein